MIETNVPLRSVRERRVIRWLCYGVERLKDVVDDIHDIRAIAGWFESYLSNHMGGTVYTFAQRVA